MKGGTWKRKQIETVLLGKTEVTDRLEVLGMDDGLLKFLSLKVVQQSTRDSCSCWPCNIH